MWIMAIRRRLLQRLAFFGMAAVALNLLALDFFAANELDHVDMSKLSGHTIVIDPGHGGIDSGAEHNGLAEKEITMAVAARLGNVLTTHGAQVKFTRDGDTDYYTKGKGGKRNDLLRRVEIIETSGAELFVSVHCNAIKGAQWFGSQVFYNPKNEHNKPLAEAVQLGLKDYPPGNKRQAKQDLKILILNSVNIPGVLVETGYLTNQREAALLADPDYQQKLAEQIAKALAYHFSQAVGR